MVNIYNQKDITANQHKYRLIVNGKLFLGSIISKKSMNFEGMNARK